MPVAHPAIAGHSPAMKFTIALIAAAFAAIVPLSAQDANKAGPKVVVVTLAEAEKHIAAGVTVIDLRTEDEFEHMHIKGAKNLNALDPNFEKAVAELDPTKPILVHCQSGRRSLAAVEGALAKAKVPTIYHFITGMSAWRKAGKPVELTKVPAESGVLPERLR